MESVIIEQQIIGEIEDAEWEEDDFYIPGYSDYGESYNDAIDYYKINYGE